MTDFSLDPPVRRGTVPSPEAFTVLPYPQTLYARAGDSSSGVVGSVDAAGNITRLEAAPCPTVIFAWDDRVARKVAYVCVWNGVVAHGLTLGATAGAPHVRHEDGTILGLWPTDPPRPARPVSLADVRTAARAA